ncbi:transposable element Tc3 transposase [Trichonephila clavipes]|nr:transposable element Tc3 transposase [Trichonephila clavipes]
MDDNARPHRSLAVEELLESEDITRMDWPAYSPDLNPIEHVWDALGRRIAARLHHPENTQQLKQMLIEEWVLLPQEMLHQLVLKLESVPLRNAWPLPIVSIDKDGHPANWRNCPAFPKIKNKKGAPAENRNKATPKSFTSKLVTPTVTYANATSNRQQMAAPIDRTETAKKSNSKPESNKKKNLPHLTNIFRPWPNSANFSRISQASSMQGKPSKMLKLTKIASTSFSVS